MYMYTVSVLEPSLAHVLTNSLVVLLDHYSQQVEDGFTNVFVLG